MPEWSIGPHSKCGERVTVPRVRIPVCPHGEKEENTFYLPREHLPFVHGRRNYATIGDSRRT